MVYTPDYYCNKSVTPAVPRCDISYRVPHFHFSPSAPTRTSLRHTVRVGPGTSSQPYISAVSTHIPC